MADLPALVMWLGIPVVVGFLLFLVSGGGSNQAMPRAKVLLVDLDETFLSGLVASGATSGRLGEFLDVERVPLDAGERRIGAGEATALLVLPKGFADGVLNEKPVEIRLVTNPAQRLLPGVVQEGLEVLVEAAFYAQRLVGPPLRELANSGPDGPSSPQVAAASAAINDRMRSLGGIALPPVLTVVTSAPAAPAQGPNFGLLFVPGILMMSVLFVAQGTSDDLWAEKRAGTLRRARALPCPVWPFLAGKLLASSVLVATIVAASLAVAWLMFAVPFGRLPAAFVWTWLAGVSLLCYFALLQTAATSERGGQLLSMMVVFPLMMLGGSLFPFDAMPAWLASAGRWTPNGLAVVRLREMLDGRAELVPVAASAAGLVVPALGAFWLAARRLAGRFPVS
jgi:ABC-type transport system involved in cytochrome c biogenesis permease component